MPETYTREIINFMNALNASTLGLYKNKVFSRIEVINSRISTTTQVHHLMQCHLFRCLLK